MKALILFVVVMAGSGCAALTQGGRTVHPDDVDPMAGQAARIKQWEQEAKAEMLASGEGPPSAVSLDPCSGAQAGIDMSACRYQQRLDQIDSQFRHDRQAIEERNSSWEGAFRRQYRRAPRGYGR